MKKTKNLRQLIILVILSLTVVQVSAIGKPKFSGTWKLNKEESQVNAQFSFAPKKVVITQNRKTIHLVRYATMQGQEITIDENVTLNGEECENPGFQGSTKVCTANWSDDKKSLIVKSKIESDWGTINTTQIYSLEGNKLKVVSTFSTSNGDIEETWILEKEEKDAD